jgi:multidrug resistance efflux pump
LLAPFAGMVVTGDLSQRLGSPVQRGEVLFEVAPLDEFRPVLQVDERDIDEIAIGQRGEIVFSAMPGASLAFAVTEITPVSNTYEGQNTFRVEAHLDETPVGLQPGLEGVAKVHVERRRLIWIWTHDVFDWLRLSLWTWLP